MTSDSPSTAIPFPRSAIAFAEMDARIIAAIDAARTGADRAIVVGLCGAQGSGKSTTARRLADALSARGLKVALLSLDDFYLTQVERRRLAERVHPLFVTRGVPGTHDVSLMQETFDRLTRQDASRVALPRFDKTIDDRASHHVWEIVDTPIDIILFEGWCVGARAQPEQDLIDPVNDLERLEDASGIWRRYVNTALDDAYGRLFSRIDIQFLLRAQGFEQVLHWRREQENRLERVPGHSLPPLSDAQLQRFIDHYERLTRWIIADQPADIVIDIDATRRPLLWRPTRAFS
ncbi:MAG: kinase [Caulobacterales bacterium]